MFNIRRIEPAFKEDMYGFTQSLLSYINGERIKHQIAKNCVT